MMSHIYTFNLSRGVMGLLLTLYFFTSTSAQAASFNCNKTSSAVERLICKHNTLLTLHNQLDQAYQALSLRLSVHEQGLLKQSQESWLGVLPLACGDVEAVDMDVLLCMETLYKDRLDVLQIRPFSERFYTYMHTLYSVGENRSHDLIKIKLPRLIDTDLGEKDLSLVNSFNGLIGFTHFPCNENNKSKILERVVPGVNSKIWGIYTSSECNVGSECGGDTYLKYIWFHVDEARLLKPSDLFKNKGWMFVFLNKIRNQSDGLSSLSDTDVIKLASDIHSWKISKDGISIYLIHDSSTANFRAGIRMSYSECGNCPSSRDVLEVFIPWKDLDLEGLGDLEERQFDCTSVSTPEQKFVCDHRALRELHVGLGQLYKSLKAQLSVDAQVRLLESQISWRGSWPLECSLDIGAESEGGEVTVVTEQVECVKRRYHERFEDLKVQPFGGSFKVYTHALYHSFVETASRGARSLRRRVMRYPQVVDRGLSSKHASVVQSFNQFALNVNILDDRDADDKNALESYVYFDMKSKLLEVDIPLMGGKYWGVLVQLDSISQNQDINSDPSRWYKWFSLENRRPLIKSDILKHPRWEDIFKNDLLDQFDYSDNDISFMHNIYSWELSDDGLRIHFEDCDVVTSSWQTVSDSVERTVIDDMGINKIDRSCTWASSLIEWTQLINGGLGWYCVCYVELINQSPKQSTACRQTAQDCEVLREKVGGGTQVLVKGSAGECVFIEGEYPWTSTSSQQQDWTASKRPGSWWSSVGCFL